MLFRVRLRGFLTVLCGLMKMAGCSVRVVSRRVMVAFSMMTGCLAMVVRRQLVVFCCLVMVLRCLF